MSFFDHDIAGPERTAEEDRIVTGKVVLNILGDICLTQDNRQFVADGNVKGLFNGVLGVLALGDLNVANLEAPVTRGGELPLEKTGPNLSNTGALLDVLSDAGVKVFGLANNHIKDFGSDGIEATLAELDARGVRYFGAGMDASSARQPLFLKLARHVVGFLAFADHEFSIAEQEEAGANGFDPFESLDDVREAKSKCDYLVVLFHGGIEHYEYPSPLLKKKLRKIVEAGADLVTAQHSHCIGAFEQYRHGSILYGQGNFLFGEQPGNDRWNSGSIIQVTLGDDGLTDVRVIPVVARRGGGTDLMAEPEAATCLSELQRRGTEVQDDALVAECWERFCEHQKKTYLPHLLGWGRLLTRLNKILDGRLVDRLYAKRARMVTHNLIRCEAHHEVLDTILRRAYEAS